MRIPILLFLLIFLGACKKNIPQSDGVSCSGDCYVLQGNILDSAANTALSGVTIQFYFKQDALVLFGTPTSYLGKAVSDANGNYSFKFDGSYFIGDRGYFYATATKTGFFFDPSGQNRVLFFDLDTSQFNIPLVQNFSLYRPSKLTVRIKASTVTNFNFLTFSYQYGKSNELLRGLLQVLDGGQTLNGGRPIDTTITCETAGNIRTFIQWSAYGNGVNINQFDTVQVPAGGNLPYLISL